MYCQNRCYDPANGRWLTRDPIGTAGGVNLYSYCGAGPVGNTDPWGLATITIRVTNENVGHAWIIIRWDDGSVWVIENQLSNNNDVVRRGEEVFLKKVNRVAEPERTLAFDEEDWSKAEVMDLVLNQMPNEYNAMTNNCCHFAALLWRLITGQVLGLGSLITPGQVKKAIDSANRDRRNMGNPMKIPYDSRLSPSKKIGGARRSPR